MTRFEDFHIGDVHEFGRRTVTREEIVEFARQFDPQPFHLDEELARQSIYGGLIASGWHVSALAMRMLVDRMLAQGDSGSMGSPGADELRWLLPVRPGDTLTLRTEVIETTPSRSKSDRGVVKLRNHLLNQHGQVVMTMIGIGMFRRRDATPG